MTLSSAISFTDQVDKVLRRQGAVRLQLDVGSPDYDLETEDWLHSLLLSSPIVRKAVGEACSRVERGGDLESHEVCPGLWLVSFGLPATGTDARMCCIVIPTQDLERSEFLDLLCQSARLDRTLVASMLGEFDLLGSTEIPRYCSFMHLAGLSECEISRRSEMLSSLGKQLGDSYEEINLYHTLIGNTSVSTTPDEFLDAVVEELQRVLPFAWVGVRLCRDLQRIPGVLDGFMIAGTTLEPPSRIAAAGDRLIGSLEGRSPVVLDATLGGLVDSSRCSRSTVVACPIVGDSGIVGVLLAGTRPGDSRTVSSIETKLLGAASEHVSVFLRNARLYANLDSMFLGTVQGMVSAIDAKDQYTRGHSQRVAWLARALARECGLPESMASRVYLAGLVHDVGKIGVPEHVLQKSGRLDDEEFGWIMRHPEIGSRILRDIPQMDDILPAVLHHHERWDGTGYPHRLGGQEIPIFARLVALADAFDAMSSTRTYRSARPREAVVAELRRCAGSQFDPELIEPFLRIDLTEYDRLVAEHGGLFTEGRHAA